MSTLKEKLILMANTESSGANKIVVLAAVTEDGFALFYAPEKFQADKEVVLAAVNQDSIALKYASTELKADKEVVLAAVNNYGCALQYASNELKANKEVVLAAVNQCGHALEYASEELKADKEIVLAAVNQHGLALKYAPDELKADKEVVLAAVDQDGWARRHVSDNLYGDTEVILTAAFQNPRILESAPCGFYSSMYDFRVFRSFLFYTKYTQLKPHEFVKTTQGNCAVAKLYGHGPHFANLFERRIGSFLGIPDGKDWGIEYDEYGNCVHGSFWKMIDKVIKHVPKPSV